MVNITVKLLISLIIIILQMVKVIAKDLIIEVIDEMTKEQAKEVSFYTHLACDKNDWLTSLLLTYLHANLYIFWPYHGC